MKRITITLTDEGKFNAACVTDETREAFSLSAITLPDELKDLNVETLEKAVAADEAVSAAIAKLKEHQEDSDALVLRAETAMQSGDIGAMPAIIADAKLFGAAREKKKLLEEVENIGAQITELEAKALEITAKADAL